MRIVRAYTSKDVLENGFRSDGLPFDLPPLPRLAIHEACVNAAKYGGSAFVLKIRRTRRALICAVTQENPVVFRIGGKACGGCALIDKICRRRMMLNGGKTLALFFEKD